MTERGSTWFERVPKVELHLHLEGAIPLDATWALLQKYGGDPGVPDEAALRRRFVFRDFPHFIETWIWRNGFMREYSDFTLVAEAAARDMARQNIRYVEAAGQAAEGIVFPCGRLLVADALPAGHPQKALLLDYKRQYESKFKEDVSTFGGHAYDAFTILAEAIKRAGSTDKDKVRQAIEDLRGFAGTAGIFNFSAADHNGLDMSSFEMLTVKNGKFVVLK